MGVSVTLRGGSGDMLKSVYDPNLDNVIAAAQLDPSLGNMKKSVYDSDVNDKIALANLEQVAHTLNAEVIVFSSGAMTTEDNMHATAYSFLGNRGYCCVKGGDYKFEAECKTNRDVGDGTCFLGYRINGGSWIQIGTTDSLTHVVLTMGAAVTLNDGDTVELGIKNDSASYYSYIRRYQVLMSKVNRIE